MKVNYNDELDKLINNEQSDAETIKINELPPKKDKPPLSIRPIDAEFKIKKEKKTYPQDWEAYDKAKTNEDQLFKKLLEELLILTIEEPIKIGAGRKGFTVKEKLFCMCIKIFYRSDLRKTTSILKELQRLNYINKAPSFKSIDNFFNDKSLSEILDNLILISALPLANLEETGAIDSTGFSVSRFDQWNKYKWGKHEGKRRVWRKAHACIGCKTNIALSVEITESHASDVSMVEEVIKTKTAYFNMKNFVADKAYLSRKVIQFLNTLNLIPYIPFKSNSMKRPNGQGYLWSRMFKEFTNHNYEFMKIYHQRSNIETCFHMIKTNYGDYLLTKKYDANVNEIKTKFLCHNICCLIQEAFESNISIDFSNCVEIINECAKIQQ